MSIFFKVVTIFMWYPVYRCILNRVQNLYVHSIRLKSNHFKIIHKTIMYIDRTPPPRNLFALPTPYNLSHPLHLWHFIPLTCLKYYISKRRIQQIVNKFLHLAKLVSVVNYTIIVNDEFTVISRICFIWLRLLPLVDHVS